MGSLLLQEGDCHWELSSPTLLNNVRSDDKLLDKLCLTLLQGDKTQLSWNLNGETWHFIPDVRNGDLRQ